MNFPCTTFFVHALPKPPSFLLISTGYETDHVLRNPTKRIAFNLRLNETAIGNDNDGGDQGNG